MTRYSVLKEIIAFMAVLLFFLLEAAQASDQIAITFIARPTAPITQGTPGHAFFCISMPVASGSKEECFGFYPQNPLKAFDGPGNVSNEFKKEAIMHPSVSLRHVISENTRSQVYSELRKWTGADYKLLVNNCGDLVFAIARAAGLRTPDRATVLYPTEFVEGLKKRYWSGSWISRDIQTRFRILFNYPSVGFTEKNPESGQELTKSLPLKVRDDGSVVIERPNSVDVLRALGYNAAIIPQILAAGPQPSFLTLSREDRSLLGGWNGLIVVKDPKGNFKGLRQPGTSGSKPYSFDLLP